MLRLAGRTVLVAGASSGIGARMAVLFANEGANVVLGARRTDRTADLARQIGPAALAVPMDVTDEASVIAAFDAATARFGRVDSVIANAGVSAAGRSTEVSSDGLRAVIDTNLLGVYLTAREGARRMMASGARDREDGRIIIIGSITAIMTGQGDAAYAATKAGVAHLARSFAREWVRQGINVNIIQPGYIETELTADWFASEGGARQREGFHRRRIMPASALDEMLVFLASDASRHVTGATITIDDGQSL